MKMAFTLLTALSAIEKIRGSFTLLRLLQRCNARADNRGSTALMARLLNMEAKMRARARYDDNTCTHI